MNFLPNRSAVIATLGFIMALGFVVWALRVADEEERREAQAPKVLPATASPWTVPGFKESVPMRIWRDPDTGCQFLIMPDGDSMGQRPATPCPDPEWLSQQKAKAPQETAK